MKNELEKLSTAIQLSKSGIAEQVQKITEEVNEGNICPLEVQALAKGLEELAKQLKEGTKDAAVDEIAKYSDKDLPVVFGCKLKPHKTTKYDYKGQIFENIKADIDELNAKQKQLQDVAKMACKNGNKAGSIVTEEGEEIMVKAATVTISDSVAVSLKK